MLFRSPSISYACWRGRCLTRRSRRCSIAPARPRGAATAGRTDGKLGLIDEAGHVVIEPRHLTDKEKQAIEDNWNSIRRHPFTIERAKHLRARIEAALADGETLAPIAGMLMPNAISDTELEAAGLLGMRVEVIADHAGDDRLIPLRAGDRGRIGWHYPVTASLFDFTVEAPVEGLRALPHGSVGVPWRLLRRVAEPV